MDPDDIDDPTPEELAAARRHADWFWFLCSLLFLFCAMVALYGCGGEAIGTAHAGELEQTAQVSGWCCGDVCGYSAHEADEALGDAGSCQCYGVVQLEPGSVMGRCIPADEYY